jgi:hypothetical protein
VNGAGVGGTRLAAVFEGDERAPELAFRGGAWTVREYEALAWRQGLKGTKGHQHWLWGRCVDGAGVGGTCLAAVLEEKAKTPALALGAVRGWYESRRHLPGGSV